MAVYVYVFNYFFRAKILLIVPNNPSPVPQNSSSVLSKMVVVFNLAPE